LRERAILGLEPVAFGSGGEPGAGQPWPLLDEPGYWALLTVGEVAQLLRCSKATVYGLIERGQLPHLTVSNAIRVRRRDVETLTPA